MSAGARLRVDPIACDGRGFCAEILPEMITLDDWGYPIIRAGDVPAGLLAEAREAVRLCPRLALRLDSADPGQAARKAASSGPAGSGADDTGRRDHRPYLPGPAHGVMEVTRR